MKVYCVSSNRDINPSPWNNQGVLLTPDMLKRGVWASSLSNSSVSNDAIRSEICLRRSANEKGYHAALEALLEVERPEAMLYTAAVSMEWCSMFNRLIIVPKRDQLVIFAGNDLVADHTFLDVFEESALDKSAWSMQFDRDLDAYCEGVRTQAQEAIASGRDLYWRPGIAIGGATA